VKKNVITEDNKFGRRFDEAFKRDAVRMLESGVRSLQQLSEELGVSVWSLGRWRKLYGRQNAAATLVLENARLRRELETVSRQRDILKKALAILGQEPSNATK
jgi:transposase